ncbi:MAG: hypothetical protein IJI54_01330 [Kiritimatiellae bacterium]|nr:hypothetical protein [Kiritimatiellia bacterium]
MSTAADKPVRHILTISGGKAAFYVRVLDIFQLAWMEAGCRGLFDEMKSMT